MSSILNNVVGAQNLSLDVKMYSGIISGTQSPDGNWSGSIGLLQKNMYDIVISPLAFSSSRFEVINYLAPVIFVEMKFLVGQSPKVEYNVGQFSESVNQILYLVLASFLCLLFVGTLSTYLIPVGTVRTLSDNALVLVTILLGKSVPVLPRITSRRLLLLIWMFSTAFVLLPIFSGLMISMISVESKPADFIRTINDFKKFPDVNVIFNEGSIDVLIFKSSKIPAYIDIWKRCEEDEHCPASFETQNSPVFLDAVENQESVLVGHYFYPLKARLLFNKTSCRFKFSEPYWASFISFGARKQLNWKMLDFINIGMLHAYEGNLFDKWEPESIPIDRCFREEVFDPTMSPFTLYKIALAFDVLLFGLGVSALALPFELIFHKYSSFN